MATTDKSIYYSLIKITTESFAVFEENCPDFKGELTDEHQIFTKLRVKFGANVDKKHIAVIFSFELVHEEKPILKIEPGLHFNITDESWSKIYHEKKGVIKLHKDVARNFIGLCVGTARGMLHSKTEGTKLNGLFIPLLQPEDFISDDVFIQIGNQSKKIPKRTSKDIK